MPDSVNARIGIVGSGPGAGAIARRIAATFGPPQLFDPGHGLESEDEHVVACRSLDELRTRADVVVTLLADEQSLRTVLLGDAGLARTKGSALTVLDLTPILPWTMQDVAESCRSGAVNAVGGSVVERTGDEGARSTLYVDDAALRINGLQGVLDALADEVVATGATGSAKAMAVLTDLLVGVNTAVVREALSLGRSAGIDAEILSLVLKGSGATAVLARIGALDAKGRDGTLGTAELAALRSGLALAVAAAHRVDHSLFFGSLGIAALFAQPVEGKAADASP